MYSRAFDSEECSDSEVRISKVLLYYKPSIMTKNGHGWPYSLAKRSDSSITAEVLYEGCLG